MLKLSNVEWPAQEKANQRLPNLYIIKIIISEHTSLV